MKTVLLIDDEHRVLDALRRMLRPMHEEWKFFFATSFDDAVVILQKSEVDAIVSDHNMPGKSGMDLLRHVRHSPEHERTPFLMLTGNPETRLLREALEVGATDFLHKPCDAVELIARLKNVIALKEFQDQILHQNEVLEERVRERTRDLESSQRDIVFRLARAAEARDTDTGHHILRVGLFSTTLARALGYDREFQDRILLTSPLHDIGKIGISDAILRKPGELTSEERLVMQQHCDIGADMLADELRGTFTLLSGGCPRETRSNALLVMAANIARHHHEHWDGSGYPTGISGEDIPIEARIVAVADVYDAMRSTRAYKDSVSHEDTLDYICSRAGSQFDPQIVQALLSVAEEFERIRAESDDEDLKEEVKKAA